MNFERGHLLELPSGINYYAMINIELDCPQHPGQPLSYVNLTLQPRQLACFLCKLQAPEGDLDLLPLKFFLNYLRPQTIRPDNVVREMARIDKELLLIRQYANKAKSKMNSSKLLEDSLARFCRLTALQVSSLGGILEQLEQLLKESGRCLRDRLNQWIGKHGHLYNSQKEAESKQNNSPAGVYNHFLQSQLEVLQDISEQLQKIVAKPNFDDSEILNLFQIVQTNAVFRLRFSEELKGQCMSILSPTKATMASSGTQRMILLEPDLSKTRNLKRWRVKIEKLASWIGVGVSHLDSIKTVNFDFSYTNSNHGNYLLSSNGYSWNGYKMDYNSKHGTTAFGTGDTMEITYEPTANRISFKKQGQDTVHTYQVDPTQKPIHASINLTGVGDTVQIVP